MRRKPDMSALPNNKIPLVEFQNEELITQIRTYQLITPLYGGGVEPEKADEISVVRATEIKGHLRFWWRAIYGGTYDDVNQMRETEEALWGAAIRRDSDGKLVSGPSAIQIEVLKGKSSGKEVAENTLDYITFPLRQGRNDNGYGEITEDVRFLMKITFKEDDKKLIENALFAWETFGGIGARTRRGFGALKLLAINKIPVENPSKESLKDQIDDLIQLVNNGQSFPKNMPHLSADKKHYQFIDSNDGATNSVWEYIIKKYKDFRQGFKDGPRGRSYWPEADAIRRRTTYTIHHAPREDLPDKFPRAEFGLPIEFKFKDRDDPKKTQVIGHGEINRLSSPLIFRPVECVNGALGIVLILEAPRTPVGGLYLKKAYRDRNITSELTEMEARQIDANSHKNRMNGHTSVLEAFLDFLEL